MQDVAKFPGLIRRGSKYSLRTYVPKDLVEVFDGRREFVTALGAADLAEATTRATTNAAAYVSADRQEHACRGSRVR